MSQSGRPSSHWGRTHHGEAVSRACLRGRHGAVADIISYGGTITRLAFPDRDGRVDNVVLGFASLAGYEETTERPYFGALIGRYANRIGNARFSLDGSAHHLAANNATASLHGGARGFDRANWDLDSFESEEGVAVRLRLVSPDGDEGYPGALSVEATYVMTVLDGADLLRLTLRATTDRATVVNLTNHTYWNLAGEGSGSAEDHHVTIDADRFLPISDALIPLPAMRDVAGSPFDFRAPRRIGAALRDDDTQLATARGYDHCYVLRHGGGPDAIIAHPASGRAVELRTTQPGLQLYSGNFLDGTRRGPGGRAYRQGDGIALEPQHFPDTPNRPDFPSCRLDPGGVYEQTISYRLLPAGAII